MALSRDVTCRPTVWKLLALTIAWSLLTCLIFRLMTIYKKSKPSLIILVSGKYKDEYSDDINLKLEPPTVPLSLARFTPREVPFIDGYLQVPNCELHCIGDIDYLIVRNNISEARDKCNKLGSSCRAFTFDRDPSKGNSGAWFKYSFGIPSDSQSRSLYLKKEFVNMFIQGLAENLTCAIPIKNFASDLSGGCKLPELDPFYKEIIHLVPTREPMKCDDTYLYTSLENNTLKIRDVVQEDGNLDFVIAEPIRRGNGDFSATLGPPQLLTFKNRSFHIQEDFWKVTSVLKNKERKITYHLSVVEKQQVQLRKSKHDSPLDIIQIMFDGTSAAHFERMLPKTYEFLKLEMKSHMFKGYSIVGDATTPNVNAMLTGNTLEENSKIQKAWKGDPNASTVDKWPFIFKDFKDHGFSTLWSEDDSAIGTFALRTNGFKDQPTDHYGRPFWLKAGGMCIGGQFQVALQLQYLKSFMKSYPGRRKYAYIFFSDLCHRELNLLSIADVEIATFLQSLKDENLFNNSMFVMMGDHGARFGKIRDTNQGKLEERLPFLSITLPLWFEERFPEETNNLRRNTQIISSPFDFHETYHHLLSFSDKTKTKRENPRGVSFFETLPSNRTCADTGITDQWCPCLTWRVIASAHAHIQKGARTAISHINKALAKNDLTAKLCHKLKLKKILHAEQKMSTIRESSKKQEDECSYQIQFESTPGDGRFEAIIRVIFTGEVMVYGSVSRINAYGSHPACIAKRLPMLRKYCYCK